MKLRELKNFLELQVEESQVTRLLSSYSHWINAIFQAKEFATSDQKDIETLKKLSELKVIDVKEEKGQLIASLNKSGRQLYQEFYGHGYY